MSSSWSMSWASPRWFRERGPSSPGHAEKARALLGLQLVWQAIPARGLKTRWKGRRRQAEASPWNAVLEREHKESPPGVRWGWVRHLMGDVCPEAFVIT